MAKPVMLLFYDGYERKAREKLIPRLYHRVRCKLRALFRRLRGKQINTGFYEAFLAIDTGLRRLGYDVHINDFESARRDPSYPIALAGYPEVFAHVDLPNPMIFGPGDPGYPDAAANIAQKSSTRFIIQPSDWFVEYYRPYCGDKMLRCPVGIDVENLSDYADAPNSCDVVVYDKIRWNREKIVSNVLDPLLSLLNERGLNYEILRYGEHKQDAYFDSLRRGRSMAFICEHETQGLACEEAMAMNVPVFAWDEGVLIDPKQRQFASEDLVVSSVPYFDERCGMTFKAANMARNFDAFWATLSTYEPREYVRENLNLAATAQVFADAYWSMVIRPD